MKIPFSNNLGLKLLALLLALLLYYTLKTDTKPLNLQNDEQNSTERKS